MGKNKYWVFKHKPGKEADESASYDFVLQAVKNNYAFMQYEYGMQDTGKVTQNWNRMLEIKEGDVIFLRGDEKIYAFGHAIRPRLKADVILKAKEIIENKDHGKYNSSEYKGTIHFFDSSVFYENLDGIESHWGQRVDVDSWQLYCSNGIPAKSQELYKEGENEYGVLKELIPQKGEKLISELYKNLGMKSECLSILENNFNLILTGAPGTGKTYLAKQLARLMLFGKINEEELNDIEKKQVEEQYDFVQFHPSFDYTDFVEGLRPKDNNGNISFRREDGIFMKFCRKALDAYNKAENKDDAPKYVFVIDEINRGDLSKIFGELFFSIDPGYRGEKGKVKTQYSNLWTDEDKYGDSEFFYIPENVYIIGTMNDIDRSVESMDFAMRRRFAFKEINAEERMEMIKKNSKLSHFYQDIENRMKNLNLAILTIQGLSTAYQIGPAYFLKLKDYLTSDDKLDDNSWTSLWKNHLKGLLFEYLRGLPNAEEDLDKLERAYNLRPTDIY